MAVALEDTYKHTVHLNPVHVSMYYADATPISILRLTAHTTGPISPEDPNQSFNHRSGLLLKQNGSIRINMTHDVNSNLGRLEWSTLANQESRSGVRYLDIYFQCHVTIKDIYKLLIEENKFAYLFNSNGTGCRFWWDSVVRSMKSRAWISDSDYQRVREFLKLAYNRDGSERHDEPIAPGTFISHAAWCQMIASGAQYLNVV